MPKGSYIWNGLHETRITAASKEKSSWNMLVLECIHFESDLLWNLLGFETKHLKQSRTCEILFSAGSCCMLDFLNKKHHTFERKSSWEWCFTQDSFAAVILCSLQLVDALLKPHGDWFFKPCRLTAFKIDTTRYQIYTKLTGTKLTGMKIQCCFFSWEFLLYSHITN